MKFAFLALFVSFSAHAAPGAYQAARDLVSADQAGPHRHVAQHQIGFLNGKVVQAYLAHARGCVLTFGQGKLARLSQGEALKVVAPLKVRPGKSENCLEWGHNSGGDDVCEHHGQPHTNQLLEGELRRERGGERVRVLCVASKEQDPQVAVRQWERSVRGLLRGF